MPEPIPLVEVTRSGVVECRHRGSIAVVQDGRLVDAVGDPSTITPARSTAKPFQLLALIEQGGVHAFSLSLPEIAVLASSHNAEAEQISTLRGILRKSGLDEADLRCGTPAPFSPGIAAAAARDTGGTPRPIHHNCSGNHIGMLLLGTLLHLPLAEYGLVDHPIQQEILHEIALLLHTPATAISTGIDGCGVPTYNLRLDALATLYGRLAVADSSPASSALGLVQSAMMAHPFMVAGSGRVDTALMHAAPLLAKAGALGVHGLAIPSQRLGIAIKIESGAEEVSGCVAIEYLRKIGVLSDAVMPSLLPYWRRPVTNGLGQTVGEYHAIF